MAAFPQPWGRRTRWIPQPEINPGTGCRWPRDLQSDSLKPSSCPFQHVKRGRQGNTRLSPMQRREARRIAEHPALTAPARLVFFFLLFFFFHHYVRPRVIGLGTRFSKCCVDIASFRANAAGRVASPGRTLVPTSLPGDQWCQTISLTHGPSRRSKIYQWPKVQIRGPGRTIPRPRAPTAVLTRCARGKRPASGVAWPRRLIMHTWNPRLFRPKSVALASKPDPAVLRGVCLA